MMGQKRFSTKLLLDFLGNIRQHSKMKITLVIIDPQNDFCDPKGALYVKGAESDMAAVAAMIRANTAKIDDIQVTLDSHQVVHIAHPIFWVDKSGKHPNPFTPISAAQVRSGEFRAFNPAFQKHAEVYVETLEKNSRYSLFIWPTHCIIGSWGHGVFPDLEAALQEWCNEFALVDYVTKGSNPFTEHYSAVRADVEDSRDPSTQMNGAFIRKLQEYDTILIAGEARSHCVSNTLRDIIQEFGSEHAKRFVILEDAMSDVPSFEGLGTQFIEDMKALGVRVSKTTEFFS